MQHIKRFQFLIDYYTSLVFLVFFFSIISFTTDAQSPVRVSIGQQIKKKVQKPMSEIAQDIQYIPLETGSDFLLSQDISEIEIFNDRIFISDFKHIFIFDRKGKFLSKIAKHGRGPGEYSSKSFMNFLLNQEKEELTIFDLISKRMITYGFDGSFLFDEKISFMPGPSEWIDENIFAVYNMGHTYEKLPWTDIYFLNTQGKVIKKNRFKHEKDKKYGFTVFPALFYTFKGKTRYKNPNENLIYEVDSDYLLNPVYYLDYGVYESKSELDEFQISINKKKEVSVRANPKSSEKIGLTVLTETQGYLHIRFAHKNGKQFGVYDKKADRFYQVFDKTYESYGFTDDILGGVPFVPRSTTEGYLVSYVHAYELMESLKGFQKDNSLKDVLTGLGEGDNPVIILGKLID